MLSTDLFFVEKVRYILGLYLNPRDKAMVFCVDGKKQNQALDRTKPLRPMGLCYVEGVTHDYIRHEMPTLFATLAPNEDLARCDPAKTQCQVDLAESCADPGSLDTLLSIGERQHYRSHGKILPTTLKRSE